MDNSEGGKITIAHLNDTFRSCLGADGSGEVFKTNGVNMFEPEDQAHIFIAVRDFNDFSENNDPYGEHDFGSIEYKETKIFWKIDYYNLDKSGGSEDPSDPAKTKRVLTVMLANEY